MKRLCRSLTLVIVAILLVAVPVLAAYYIEFIVTESNGTDYTRLAMNMTLNVTGLVDGGFISSTGMDTRMTDSGYNVLPHMMAEDKVMWVSYLPGSTSTQFIFFTGQSALNSTPTITGYGGYVTVPDNADLELGGVFAIAIVGYVDTSAAARGPIIDKTDAVQLDVTAVEELTFAVTGGNSLVASNISSGFMTIMVYSDGADMWVEIDDVEKDREVASLVPDTASNWTLFDNDVMPYVSYFSIWIA